MAGSDTQDQLEEIQEDTSSMEEKIDSISEVTDQKQSKPWLFKKGQSGNPAGRPEGSVSIVEGIKRKLLDLEPGNKKTYLELFLSKLFLKAIKEGDVTLMRDIINRVDGMPKQYTDITSGGKEIQQPLVVSPITPRQDKTQEEQ